MLCITYAILHLFLFFVTYFKADNGHRIYHYLFYDLDKNQVFSYYYTFIQVYGIYYH